MKHVVLYIIFSICLLGFSQESTYTITNLSINDENPHFGLMYAAKDRIIFTSYKLSKNGKIKHSGVDPILTVYEGSVSDDGEIINVKPLQIDEKQGISHITSASLSPDGKQLYLTTYYTKKNKPKGKFKDTNFHLEVGEYVNGLGWTNFKVLPFCNPKYSYGHPAFGPDGKTLYFISNTREGNQMTKGGSDIFRVELLEDNTFSEPENLGSKINSYSREMFPFVSSDQTLYFSSNRPNGIGGFDIYRSRLNTQGEYEKAERMPKPINSRASDFSFIIDANNKNGYFSSKRNKGKGDDDIYVFIKE